MTNATIDLLPQADLVAQCATNVVLPTGDIKIADGDLSTNKEKYKEFWYTMVGLAGEGQNFDGNGQMVRFQPGGGDQTFSTGVVPALGDRLYGNAASKPLGSRPAFPSKRPPYKPEEPCKDQKIPDLNGARTGPADGAGNPQPGGGGGSGGSGGGLLPTIPGVPLPPIPVPRVRAGTSSSGEASIAADLLSALNPLRKPGGR